MNNQGSVIPAKAGIHKAQVRSKRVELADSLEAVQEHFEARGWSDGLPIVPPTPERVETMLGAVEGGPDREIGLVPPRFGVADLEVLAINAVMAGCKPGYFPVVVAAVDALLDPAFNLYGIQATTHPVGPLLLVNGPVADRLGIPFGPGAMGPTFRASATIGRAIRLVLLNVGGATPGTQDRSTHGSPAKYGFCFAENVAASPWAPFHMDLGYPAETSTVTVFGVEGPHNVNDHGSIEADQLLRSVAETFATPGCNNSYYQNQGCQLLAVLCPEHAAIVSGSGWTKDDARRFIFEHARVPASRFSRQNVERKLVNRWPRALAEEARGWLAGGPEPMVPLATTWEDVQVVVAGGPGKHSAVLPSFGATRAVTRIIVQERVEGRV